MGSSELLRLLIALAIGLLLGSVLPADLLARRRGVDIRATGDGNPGTVNAVRALGWAPGLLTAAYDVSVGVIAIQIAALLAISGGLVYLAGITTIVGHRFPVFRRFRGGGQGMAASAGVLVYGIAEGLSRGWLSVATIGFLVAVLAVAFALTRSDKVAAIAMLPFLVADLMLARTSWPYAASMSAVAAYVWIVQVAAVRHRIERHAVGSAAGHTRD